LPFCVRAVAAPQTVVRAETMVVLGYAVVLVVKVEFWARAVLARAMAMGTANFIMVGFDAAVVTVFYTERIDELPLWQVDEDIEGSCDDRKKRVDWMRGRREREESIGGRGAKLFKTAPCSQSWLGA
jgi:hypothetical protein